MKFTAAFIASFAALALAPVSAQAVTTVYTDSASFFAAADDTVTDDYENTSYQFINSNAAMTAVLGETRYETTGFLNWNIVYSVDDHGYCAGCNGSFNLFFDQTSVGTSNGVEGVGFDIEFSDGSYDAFVTFGDGSTQNYANLTTGYFGLTSDLRIASMKFGPMGGSSTTGGVFGIDNLTIAGTSMAAPVAAVPEPSTWAMMIVGFGAVGGSLRTRRTKRMAFAA